VISYGNYPDLASIQRVLVIKLRHLGDVLLTSPVFTILKRALPQAKIDAYVYRESVPMLEGHPAISGILSYDREWKKKGWAKKIFYEAAQLRRIRNNHYDLVINLTEGDRGAWMARWSQAKVRVGVDGRKIYTHVVKQCPAPRHNVEKQLDALRRIGIRPAPEERDLVLNVSDNARDSVGKKIFSGPFILIHPSSRWRFKCWPQEKMARLSQKLIEKGRRLIFTSGPNSDEIAMVDEIVRDLPHKEFLNLAGKITLQELTALIEQCAALCCVDSVPFHIASALKAPAVAIFGPTSEIGWGPWRNPSARVVSANMSCRPCCLDGCGGSKISDCLDSISVDRVLSELEIVSEIGASRLRIVDELVHGSR
jgi:heptosyltransferase-3